MGAQTPRSPGNAGLYRGGMHEIDLQTSTRQVWVNIETEWRTPAGNQRNVPMYAATIGNTYLGTTQTFRGTDRARIEKRALAQLQKWSELESRQRETASKRDALERAEAEAEALDAEARETVTAVTNLLEATLSAEDRIDWEELRDRREPDPFEFGEPALSPPDATPNVPAVLYDYHPPKPWYAGIWPGANRRWEERCATVDAANDHLRAQAETARDQEMARCEQVQAQYAVDVRAWSQRRDAARQRYEAECAVFVQAQREHNSKVDRFKDAFEKGAPQAVAEYLRGVFERSDYPDSFPVGHTVEFDGASRHAAVTLDVPGQGDFPSVTGYTFVRSKREAKPTAMKKREHGDLYERAVAQVVLRTLHEIFEADYVPVVRSAEVNAFVTSVDPATGTDQRTYVAAVSATRDAFLALDLTRLDPVACVKSLSHAVMSSG